MVYSGINALPHQIYQPEESPTSSLFLRRTKGIAKKIHIDLTEVKNKTACAKWLTIKIIWIIVLVVYLFFAVFSSLSIVSSYAQGSKTSTLSTMYNQSIALPISTICLPLIPSEFDENQKPIDNQSINSTMAFMNNTYYLQIVHKYFDQVTNKESVLDEKIAWSNQFLFIAQNYLAWITQFEDLDCGDSNVFGFNDFNDLEMSMLELDKHLKTLDITTNEFRQKFGSLVSVAYALKVHHVAINESSETNIEIQSISYVGFDKICYQFRFDLHPFQEVGEMIVISAIQASLPNARNYNTTQDLQALVDLTGRSQVSANQVDNNQVFASKLNENWLIPIGINAIYIAMPTDNGVTQCSETITLDQCKTNCRIAQIQDSCNCDSSFLSGNTSFIFKCYLTQYISCLNDLKFQDALQDCIYNCPRLCQHTLYEVQSADETTNAVNQVTIRLAVNRFVYPLFEETPVWTFPSFIGSLGGIVGLWLGLNLLDIVSFIAEILVPGEHESSKSKDAIWKWLRRIPWYASDTSAKTKVATQLSKNPVFRNETSSSKSSKKLPNFPRRIRCLKNVFIRNRKFFIVKGIWAILVVALIVLTILWTVETIEDYISKPKISNVTFAYSKTLALPNSTVCAPLYFGELNGNVDQSNLAFNEDLSAYFNNITTKESILTPGYELWPNTLLNVVHAYLIEISNCESAVLNSFNQCGKSEILENIDLVLAFETLENKIATLNVSIEELQKKFGRVVTRLLYLIITLNNDVTYEYSAIHITQMTFINDEQICFSVPLNLYPLTQMSSITVQTKLTEGFPNPIKTGLNRGIVYIDFLNRRYIESSQIRFADSVILANYAFLLSAGIEVSAVDKSLPENPDGSQRCSSTKTVDECQAACQVKAIQKLCNCIPKFWPMYNSTIVQDGYFCTLELYWSCLNSSTGGQNTSAFYSSCIGLCLRPCEIWNYKYAKGDDLSEFVYYGTTGVVCLAYLSFKSMNYPIVEEQLEWTFQSFLGEIGGIVGFLLGYSLFQILEYIFFAFTSFITYMCTKLKSMKSTPVVTVQSTATITRLHVISIPKRRRKIKIYDNFSKILHLSKLGSKGETHIFLKEISLSLLKFITIVVFTYFTIVMGMALIQDYRAGNTVSSVVLNLKKSLALPKSTICLYLGYDEFNELPGKDMPWLNLPTEFQDRIQDYFNQTKMTKETFLNEKSWTGTIIYVTFKYFLTMNSWDRGGGPSINNETFAEEGSDLLAAIWLLEEHMKSLNASANDLRQTFGRFVAGFVSLKAVQLSSSLNNKGCTVSKETEIPITWVTSIGFLQICYQIPLDHFPFYDPQQTIVVTTAKFPDGTTHPTYFNSDGTTNENRNLNIDFTGGNVTGIEEPAVLQEIQCTFATFRRYTISVDAVYRSMPSEECSEHTTWENCQAYCQVDKIRRNCNCTPTSWSAYSAHTAPTTEYPECKLSERKSCQNYTNDDGAICNLTCVSSLCEHWSYRSFSKVNEKSDVGGRIEIKVVSFDYAAFEEQYAWTFDTITGAIGGVIGFYLGLDFLMITHFCFDTLKFLQRAIYCMSSQKKQ